MTDTAPLPMIVAAAALIDGAGRVLVHRRPPGKPLAGLWEFPGGKLEAGEAPEAALVRELAEELGIRVAADDCDPLAFSTGVAGSRDLILLLYVVATWQGDPTAGAAAAVRWVTPKELATLATPAADIPLVAALVRHLAPAPG